MSLIDIVALASTCLLVSTPTTLCLQPASPHPVSQVETITPLFSGQALDVVITADAAIVWDLATGKILYAKQADEPRPIASLNKLISVLLIRQRLSPEAIVEIPPAVTKIQRTGAHIRLPVGDHARVADLLAASLIASANDAVITLATAAAGSEEEFVVAANAWASQHGLTNTRLATATGLAGGDQFSTARDVQRAFMLAYNDQVLAPLLAQAAGELRTTAGVRRVFTSTNDLLKTYVPVVAAKTGYTVEAKENLALITAGPQGQYVGAIVLGSDNRFQDMKVLVEWTWRNFTWPATGR